MATQAAAATNAAFKGNLKEGWLHKFLLWFKSMDKPTYTPNHDEGDMCIMIHAKDICVSGRKLKDKVYYWNTGYIGHLKQRTLKEQMVKDSTEVIRKAVMTDAYASEE